jgi:hypothetical protein
MEKHHLNRAITGLGIAIALLVSGCQRPAGQNGAVANEGGNQALSQNPNAMSESGLPRTANTPLNEIDPKASQTWSNSSDEVPPPGSR